MPHTDARNLWLPQTPPPIGRPWGRSLDADCAIVGAGFTGLACAHTLAALRPDWTIAVVDALRVGQAASGRNAGYVMNLGHVQSGWSLEANRGVTTLSEHGISLLRGWVAEHGIACAWHEGPRYHVAVNGRGRRALAHFREGMTAMGSPYRDIDPVELSERVGTDHYCDAAEVRGGALVDPAALVRGIARALPDSVHLYEDAPVRRIDQGPPHQLWLSNRSEGSSGADGEEPAVRARRLVLATNGFLGTMGQHRGRVLPFVTFASATAPLSELPGTDAQWGLVPEERMGCTVRGTADRRILVRGGIRYRNPPRFDAAMCRDMANEHRSSLAKRFPALANVPFTHTWGGVLGVTNNNGTAFGSFGDGAWLCGAHNGVGMALGTALGEQIAHRVAGETHALEHLPGLLPAPSWMPPEPLLSLGIRVYTTVLAWLAGDEK